MRTEEVRCGEGRGGIGRVVFDDTMGGSIASKNGLDEDG